MAVHSTNWEYYFWENPSASEYARRQGVKPATDANLLYGSGEPKDWEGFDDALDRWRMENPCGSGSGG